MGPVQYPSIGSSLANQLGGRDRSLPSYVSVGPYRSFNQEAFSPGFLGPKYGPLIVGAADIPGAMNAGGQGFPELKVQSLERQAGIDDARMNKRLDLWKGLQADFLGTNRGTAAVTHNSVYAGAVQLMNSQDAKAFDLSKEPEKLREEYGRSRGLRSGMPDGAPTDRARRRVFRSVSRKRTVVVLARDTHSDNFNAVKTLSSSLDAGWATLMKDLDERGLLESTTILWMGEFGRTPQINGNSGRDHFPSAWSAVLAGGGIAGGQAWGKNQR